MGRGALGQSGSTFALFAAISAPRRGCRTHREGRQMTERRHPLRHSQQDAEAACQVQDTAQTRAPAYKLAFADTEFMTREELRPVRLQLELLKPEMVMDERGINFDRRGDGLGADSGPRDGDDRGRGRNRRGARRTRMRGRRRGAVALVRRGAEVFRADDAGKPAVLWPRSCHRHRRRARGSWRRATAARRMPGGSRSG